MHCWVDGRETWTARWEWAVCAAGWVGQEVGNGCTAGWVGERSGLLGGSGLINIKQAISQVPEAIGRSGLVR